tara:strand:- start:288 stop:743 length:456 start_codon:yes stop_codon:yes gene_type:complete
MKNIKTNTLITLFLTIFIQSCDSEQPKVRTITISDDIKVENKPPKQEIALTCGGLKIYNLNFITGIVSVTSSIESDSPLFRDAGYSVNFFTSPTEYYWESRGLIDLGMRNPYSPYPYEKLNRETLILRVPNGDGQYREENCNIIDTDKNKI